MEKKKVQLRIKQKTEAIKHFKDALKNLKDKKVEPPKTRPDLQTEKGMKKWYENNIKALENKIAYEQEDLKRYKKM